MVQSIFSQEGRYLGIGIPREQIIHLDTLLVKGERKGERSGYRQGPVISIVQATHRHNPYGKREKGTGMVHSIIWQVARPSHHTGQARPDEQAETFTQWAETLTH